MQHPHIFEKRVYRSVRRIDEARAPVAKSLLEKIQLAETGKTVTHPREHSAADAFRAQVVRAALRIVVELFEMVGET